MEWSSGEYPEKLVIAMKNFDTVYSAWDDDELVGMICVMDDGIMNAYVHYLLVKPDYQLMRIVVICMMENVKFYEYCGFDVEEDKRALFITELEN